MRRTLFASVAILGLTVGGGAAFAQSSDNSTVRPGHEPGVGTSEPMSSQASNILPSDTRSTIAPSLPTPPASASADPRDLLRVAQRALRQNRTGEAQEALERAESRMLDRSTSPAQANSPDNAPMVAQITQVRDALGRGDTTTAQQLIASALQSNDTATAAPVAVPSDTGMMPGSAGTSSNLGGMAAATNPEVPPATSGPGIVDPDALGNPTHDAIPEYRYRRDDMGAGVDSGS